MSEPRKKVNKEDPHAQMELEEPVPVQINEEEPIPATRRRRNIVQPIMPYQNPDEAPPAPQGRRTARRVVRHNYRNIGQVQPPPPAPVQEREIPIHPVITGGANAPVYMATEGRLLAPITLGRTVGWSHPHTEVRDNDVDEDMREGLTTQRLNADYSHWLARTAYAPPVGTADNFRAISTLNHIAPIPGRLPVVANVGRGHLVRPIVLDVWDDLNAIEDQFLGHCVQFNQFIQVLRDQIARETDQRVDPRQVYDRIVREFVSIFRDFFVENIIRSRGAMGVSHEIPHDELQCWLYASQSMGDTLEQARQTFNITVSDAFYAVMMGRYFHDAYQTIQTEGQAAVGARSIIVEDTAMMFTAKSTMQTAVYDKYMTSLIAWTARLPITDDRKIIASDHNNNIRTLEEVHAHAPYSRQDRIMTDTSYPLKFTTYRQNLMRLGYDYLLHKRLQTLLMGLVNNSIRNGGQDLVFYTSIFFTQFASEVYYSSTRASAERGPEQLDQTQQNLFGAVVELNYFKLEEAVWYAIKQRVLQQIAALKIPAQNFPLTIDAVRTLTAQASERTAPYRQGGGQELPDLYTMQCFSCSFGSMIDQTKVIYEPNLTVLENRQLTNTEIERALVTHDVAAVHQIVLMFLTFLARLYTRTRYPGQLPQARTGLEFKLYKLLQDEAERAIINVNIRHLDYYRHGFYLVFYMDKPYTEMHLKKEVPFPLDDSEGERVATFWQFVMDHQIMDGIDFHRSLDALTLGDPAQLRKVQESLYQQWRDIILLYMPDDEGRPHPSISWGVVNDAVDYSDIVVVFIAVPLIKTAQQMYSSCVRELRDGQNVRAGLTYIDFDNELNLIDYMWLPTDAAKQAASNRQRRILEHQGLVGNQTLQTEINLINLVMNALNTPYRQNYSIGFRQTDTGVIEIKDSPAIKEISALLYETVYKRIVDEINRIEEDYFDNIRDDHLSRCLLLRYFPFQFIIQNFQISRIFYPQNTSMQRENFGRVYNGIQAAMRYNSYHVPDTRAAPPDPIAGRVLADRNFMVGEVNWFFSVYDFPAEIFMRYAYPHLDQRIYRRFPCVWVMVLTIIHLVTKRIRLQGNPRITVNDLVEADKYAQEEVYKEKYQQALLDFTIRDHLPVLLSAIATVQDYTIKLLAPAINKEYILAGNTQSIYTIQFIVFAHHIALAREEIKPSLILRQRDQLVYNAPKLNYKNTPFTGRVIYKQSEIDRAQIEAKRAMMDDWDSSTDAADVVLTRHHFLEKVGASKKKKHANGSSRQAIDIYFDIETTSGEGVKMQIFMLAYRVVFRGFTPEHRAYILDDIEPEACRDQGDLAAWFCADFLRPIYERNLQLYNESRAGNNQLSRPPTIYVYAHNGSRFDTLFFLPQIFNFWPYGTQIFGELRDMRYMTTGSNGICFVDTWRQLGGGALGDLAKMLRCEQQKGDNGLLLSLRTRDQYLALPEADKEDLRKYNMLDVQVLNEVHDKFKILYIDMLRTLVAHSPKLVEALGDGSYLWKPTFAHTAFNSWKSILFPPALDLQPQLDERLYAIETKSFFGGITCVLDHKWHQIDEQVEQLVYLDVNSLYPSCMTSNFATSAGVLSLLPNDDDNVETRLTLENIVQDDLYAISAYDHKGLLQCFIPRRVGETTIYPQQEDMLFGKGIRDEDTRKCRGLDDFDDWIDKECAWVWGITLAAALSYQPDAIFMGVAKLHYPVQHRIFKRIDEFFKLRQANKGTVMDPILKLAMNSVFGKLAQKIYDEKMYVAYNNLPFDPEKAWYKENDDWTAAAQRVLWETWFSRQTQQEELRKQINPDVLAFPPLKAIRFMEKLNLVELTVNSSKTNRISNTQGLVNIASKITAMARNQFVSMILDAQRAGFTPIYGDTDSIVIRGPANRELPYTRQSRKVIWRQPTAKDPFPRGGVRDIGEQLGELKIEQRMKEFQAFAPKFYAYFPNKKTGEYECVCKGMRFANANSAKAFAEQQRHNSTATNEQLQWSRLSEGEASVFQHKVAKTTTVHPKRFVNEDGTTRPFTDIQEYELYKKKTLKMNNNKFYLL